MREIPDCLNRRYKALDELIQELSSMSPRCETDSQSECSEPGIKLMCEFWNILKQDPDCNLTQAVKQRMGITNSSVFHPQRVTCYMAKGKPCCKEEGDDKRRDALNKLKNLCCKGADMNLSPPCCTSKTMSPTKNSSDALPLSKVLCNLKEAASFDKKCNDKINELMSAQKELQDQIQHLEHREKEGVKLLKQADCMWSCMEDAYKKRVAESLERQKGLMKQLKEVETSNAKWRKNKKDLELQMTNLNKCQQDITDKINQKNNDIKCMDTEIGDFQKRIESNNKETDAAIKSLSHKKQASDIKIASIAAEVSRLQKSLGDENKCKYNKEQEGSKFVKEAREDLQKICRVLLQKKLENADLRAEKDSLLDEINLLNQTMDQCKDRCKNKQDSINEEIKKLDKEISEFKVKCIRCHQCTDTIDVRKYCTDCPKCIEERDCIYEDDHCRPDPTMDCVCMSVKQKFLDNVFDNMYTVLERQSNTGPGKAVAEAILKCLKRSRNGKLNAETKKILQDFILNTVKKNLNLTIIGGAVKTRCEMDPETYKQLMLCLKQVKAVKPPKVDKGTVAKKESCRRWGGTSECNCPSGPKACICTKRAPPPPKDPTPCPPTTDKDDDPGEVKACPHKDSTACGPDCAMHSVPSCVGADVAAWRPDPCVGPACPFSKSMRAAQCVLGPESLNSIPKSFMSTAPYAPDIPVLENLITCRCGKTPVKPCTCTQDRRSRPRERIIEEVMGRYIEVTPIEKVTSVNERKQTLRRTVEEGCNCSTINNIRLIKLASKASKNKHSQKRNRSSECILLEGTGALIEMLKKKKQTHVCKNIDCGHSAKQVIRLFPNPEPKPISKDIDTGLTVILDPKFYPPNTKMDENTSPLTSYLSTCNSRCNEEASLEKSVGNKSDSSVTYFGRNVSETVKDLMKDIVVSDSYAKNSYGSGVEWMTVESFIQKLSLLPPQSKDNDSNITSDEVEVTNVKQLKTINTKDCDKSTCEREKEDFNRRFSLIEKEIRRESYVKYPSVIQTSIKNVPSVQSDVFCGGKNMLGGEQSIENDLNGIKTVTFEEKRKNETEDQFRVLMSGSNSNSNSSFTNLTYTESGNLAMALDENVIELIDKKISENPNIIVTLKKTESGHLAVDFSVKDTMDGNNYRVSVNKTPSGTRFFKVNKNFVSKLQAKDEEGDIGNQNISGDRKNEITSNKPNEILKTIKNNTKEKIYPNEGLLYELRQKYEAKMNIDVKVQGENGLLKEINVPITKTLSGNLGFDVHELFLFKNSLNGAKESPVVLTKNKSVSYDLYLHQTHETPNAVIRKTPSGEVLVVVCDPVLNSMETAKFSPKEEFYKVKIKTINSDFNDLPAVLKSTPSQNYTIVIDKEYEKDYKKTINQVLGHSNECYINMSQTNSGNYVIDVDNTSNEPSNALFVKSPSGNIRVLKNNLTQNLGLKKSSVDCKSKVFNELLSKLPTSFKASRKESCNATKISSAKSSSDSNLYEKVKMLTPNYADFLTKPLESLTETSSGQYAIVLGKESKKTFINNMKTYLKSSPHGLIPVKRTDSGEITILLDADHKEKTHYGSLKITPSGNIYIMVDKNIVKGIKKDSKKNEDAINSITIDTISSHMIAKVNHPVNKAVTTTCNARPDACSCDASKCVCKELQCKSIWNEEKENNLQLFHPQICGIDWRKVKRNPDGSYKICDPSKCTESCCKNVPPKNEKTYTKEKLPHIVIKPCACQPTFRNNPHAEEQCFYVEAVCPYHKNRYDSVSNDLLEISGLCKNITEQKIKPENSYNNNTSSWDSLHFLTPQLPDFLRDFKYR